MNDNNMYWINGLSILIYIFHYYFQNSYHLKLWTISHVCSWHLTFGWRSETEHPPRSALGESPLTQPKPLVLEPDLMGQRRACHPASPLMYCQRIVFNGRIDRLVHQIHFSCCPAFPPWCCWFWHWDKTERELWMIKNQGGQKEAVSLCSREECGNVPALCQTSLKGVKAHSASVGKRRRDGAHRQNLKKRALKQEKKWEEHGLENISSFCPMTSPKKLQ